MSNVKGVLKTEDHPITIICKTLEITMSSSTEAEGETGPIFNFHSIVFQLVFILFPLLNHFHHLLNNSKTNRANHW